MDKKWKISLLGVCSNDCDNYLLRGEGATSDEKHRVSFHVVEVNNGASSTEAK